MEIEVAETELEVVGQTARLWSGRLFALWFARKLPIQLEAYPNSYTSNLPDGGEEAKREKRQHVKGLPSSAARQTHSDEHV